MTILTYTLTFIYIFIILFISAILKNRKILSEEASRKLVHILVSFAYIIMYKLEGISINIVIIPLIFVILNYISYKRNLFKGMEVTSRKSLGTIYYPISMTIMALITLCYNDFYPYYGMGLFIMAFADGFAPIIANKYKTNRIGKTNRSISGSVTIFIISIIIILIFDKIFNINYNIIEILIISIISTMLELISGKYDNLILPIGISIIAYLFKI